MFNFLRLVGIYGIFIAMFTGALLIGEHFEDRADIAEVELTKQMLQEGYKRAQECIAYTTIWTKVEE